MQKKKVIIMHPGESRTAVITIHSIKNEKFTIEANEEAEVDAGEIMFKDTKLSALPSTGGIGTTIFTIAGCLIMVTAAGLFFASRKKANK